MTERTWVYFVLLAGALVVGGLLLREPVLGPYQELARQAEADRAKASELRAELRSRRNSTRAAASVLAWFGQPLSPDDRKVRATQVYRRVEAMVLSSGLHLDSIQPKPDSLDEQGLVRFPVTLSVSGEMGQVVALLAQARSTSGVIAVERLNLKRRDDPARPMAMQATLVAYGMADRATRTKLAKARSKSAKRGDERADNEA